MSTICVDKENASSNKSSVLIGKSSLLAVNKSLAVGGGGGSGHHLMSCHTPNEKQRMIGSVLTPQLKQKCPGLTSVEITNTGKKRAFGANLLNTIASGKTPQLTVSHATPVVNRSKLGSRCHTQLKMQNEVSAAESMVTSDNEDLLQVPPVEHCFANKYDDYADMHDYEAIDRLVDEIRVTTAASRARSPIRIYVDNVEQQRAADENGEKNVRKMNKAIRKKESREMRSTIYTLSSMNLNDMEMMPPPPPSLVGLMLDDNDLDSLCFA